MEPSSSVILESCNETSIIIQSVKGYHNLHYDTLNEMANVNSMEQSRNSDNYTDLCRICANSNNHMISIFDDEGIQHDLCNKIHKYLPIRVCQSDTLPLHLCYHCTSTLLAWHDLIEGCLNAEQKLIQMQAAFNVQEAEKLVSTVSESVGIEDVEKPPEPTTEPDSLPEKIIEEKINADEKQSSVNDERSCNVSTGCKVFVNVQDKLSNITTNVPDIAKDQFNGDWPMDNDEINSVYNDAPESQPVQNEQEKNLMKTNNNTNMKMKCGICSIAFPDIKVLHAHVKTHNLPKTTESYQCVECSKCFKLKDSLVRHLRIHIDERSFTCHVCGKQFRDSGGLSRHLNDVHAKRKPFSCDICHKNFASGATRNDHRRTHTGERPYVCQSCGKKFKSKACLYIHSKVHTNDFPHPCLLCSKKFRRRQELLCHMTTHTGEKNFCCDICQRRFRIKSELARHTRTHSEEKPFTCNNCGLSFRQRRYLNNHIKGRHSQSDSCQSMIETDH